MMIDRRLREQNFSAAHVAVITHPRDVLSISSLFEWFATPNALTFIPRALWFCVTRTKTREHKEEIWCRPGENRQNQRTSTRSLELFHFWLMSSMQNFQISHESCWDPASLHREAQDLREVINYSNHLMATLSSCLTQSHGKSTGPWCLLINTVGRVDWLWHLIGQRVEGRW